MNEASKSYQTRLRPVEKKKLSRDRTLIEFEIAGLKFQTLGLTVSCGVEYHQIQDEILDLQSELNQLVYNRRPYR